MTSGNVDELRCRHAATCDCTHHSFKSHIFNLCENGQLDNFLLSIAQASSERWKTTVEAILGGRVLYGGGVPTKSR